VTPLVIRRSLSGRQQRVFDACTRPEIMCRWFWLDPRSSARVFGNVRADRSYRLEMRDEAGAMDAGIANVAECVEISRPRGTATRSHR